MINYRDILRKLKSDRFLFCNAMNVSYNRLLQHCQTYNTLLWGNPLGNSLEPCLHNLLVINLLVTELFKKYINKDNIISDTQLSCVITPKSDPPKNCKHYFLGILKMSY